MNNNSGINKIFLIGHIIKGARSHRNQREKNSTLHFSLVTEEIVIKDGHEIFSQEYHNIKVPGKIAGNDTLSFVKGRMLFLEGSIKQRSFIDTAGVKHYTAEIWVRNYQLLS
jgi:single-strand DNA-binding protein